jgi:hypothetical protein
MPLYIQSLGLVTRTWCLETQSLPSTAVSVYGNENYTWVTWIPINSGSINIVAFDFENVATASTDGVLLYFYNPHIPPFFEPLPIPILSSYLCIKKENDFKMLFKFQVQFKYCFYYDTL